MILYAVASEQSLGRLFLAGIGPALLLVAFFAAYAAWRYRFETRARAHARAPAAASTRRCCRPRATRCARSFAPLPRVLPFVILLTGVMVALYGGFATPSETAGLGAVLALVADRRRSTAPGGPASSTRSWSTPCRESTMLMMIIGMSLLYSYVMSYLHISQSAAEWIVSMHLSRWVLLAAILVLVVVLGFFLPPVSIILMTAPIILPPLKAAGFDLDLVRRGHDHRHGDGADPPAGRAQSLRHQEHRARHPLERRDLGRAALCRPDDGGGRGPVLRCRKSPSGCPTS